MTGNDGNEGSAAPVAIIGGGWAGCAAAVRIAQAGIPVALFEAAPVLGGRARRVTRAGLPLDNGQHLLLGAYEDTRSLMDLVHGVADARATMTRTRMAIAPLARQSTGTLALDCGFASHSHFTAAFRAVYGIAPSALRARGS